MTLGSRPLGAYQTNGNTPIAPVHRSDMHCTANKERARERARDKAEDQG